MIISLISNKEDQKFVKSVNFYSLFDPEFYQHICMILLRIFIFCILLITPLFSERDNELSALR